MRTIALAIALVVGLILSAFAQKAEIEAVNAKWIDFFNKGDFAGVASLYTAPPFTMPEPGGNAVASSAEGPSGLTSRVISFGSLTCSAMLFHSASIAALPFTMPEPGGNAVASSV